MSSLDKHHNGEKFLNPVKHKYLTYILVLFDHN